jgi:lysophospholipase L1-like esterase
VRQTGTITQVRFYWVATANVTGFYVTIWRKRAANAYDRVAHSANLISQIADASFNTIAVSLAAEEGDFIGHRIDQNSAAANRTFALTGLANAGSYLINSQVTANRGFAWESQTAASGSVFPIECSMHAPTVVTIGDSLIAGHPDHYSFVEATDTTSVGVPLAYGLKPFFRSVQNVGIGSETTTQIAARFAADVVALAPRYAVIDGGVNDINTAVPQATFLANWTTILDACRAASIRPIILKLMPWTNGTNPQMTTRDTWRAALDSLLTTSYADLLASGGFTVDLDPVLGVFRVGGAVGNLWDIQAQYSGGDGVHFNAAGYRAIATAIIAAAS